MKASYRERNAGERSRDACNPDQDTSASRPRFVPDHRRSFTWHALCGHFHATLRADDRAHN